MLVTNGGKELIGISDVVRKVLHASPQDYIPCRLVIPDDLLLQSRRLVSKKYLPVPECPRPEKFQVYPAHIFE
jgi:hypothetical protein